MIGRLMNSYGYWASWAVAIAVIALFVSAIGRIALLAMGLYH